MKITFWLISKHSRFSLSIDRILKHSSPPTNLATAQVSTRSEWSLKSSYKKLAIEVTFFLNIFLNNCDYFGRITDRSYVLLFNFWWQSTSVLSIIGGERELEEKSWSQEGGQASQEKDLKVLIPSTPQQLFQPGKICNYFTPFHIKNLKGMADP